MSDALMPLSDEELIAEIESLRRRDCPYHIPVNADDTSASCDLGVGEATEAGCPRVAER